MTWTICKISVLRLWNNKQELVLALVVPILFFSIFALIFSRGMGQSLTRVRVSFVDDDQTPESIALIRDACSHPEINPVTGVGRTVPEWSIERLSRYLITHRNAEVVVYFPKGFTTQSPEAPTLSIKLMNAGGNPLAHRLVQASLAESIALQFSKANMMAMPVATDIASAENRENNSATPRFVLPASLSSNEKGASVRTASFQLSKSDRGSPPGNGSDVLQAGNGTEPEVFESVDAFAHNKYEPKVAMAAAGIAVMFLLFSASGAGGSLLEEREAGTLGRILSSHVRLPQLLLGKWLYMTGLGCLQLFLMFLWGQIVFHVDLWGHLLGFAAMTVATASASASFALFLAAACRSRQQLHGVSIILILTMSALGGSMVPRYVMSEGMQRLGVFTFNGWALDGFQKVFWYDLPLSAIRTELLVLGAISLLFGFVASQLAKRWSLA